jgi:hypothetical protein
VRTLSGVRPRHHHTGTPPPHPLSGSADLRAVREYVVGDEVRHLHWKALARTGSLMVREYVDPAQPRFTLLLDDRSGVLPARRSRRPWRSPRRCCTRPRPTAGTPGCSPPRETARGPRRPVAPAAARTLLDRLSELQQAPGGAEPASAAVRRRDEGGLLVYVSGGRGAADAPTLRSLLAAFPRLVVFDLAPTADAPPRWVPVVRAPEAAAAVRAWNLGVAG